MRAEAGVVAFCSWCAVGEWAEEFGPGFAGVAEDERHGCIQLLVAVESPIVND